MSKLWLTLGLSGLRVFGFVVDPWLSNGEIHRIVGEPSRINRQVDGEDHLQVITWNIEQGAAYTSILDELRRLDADILLLQEVDRDCRRTEYRDVARDLAGALGMNWIAAGEFQEIGEARRGRPAITGQAILSKFPIEESGRGPIRQPGSMALVDQSRPAAPWRPDRAARPYRRNPRLQHAHREW